jgi:hypothetical protein
MAEEIVISWKSSTSEGSIFMFEGEKNVKNLRDTLKLSPDVEIFYSSI